MIDHKRIDESIWSKFGKDLSQKGKEKAVLKNQLEFLQACRNGKEDFLKYLEKELPSDKVLVDGKDVSLNHNFTEEEFRFPPRDTQQIIWNTFNKIDRENMGLCGFWGNIVINMIKDDCISPDYLASNLNGVNETGLYMLDDAIFSNNGKVIDNCSRRVLRSMGCLPQGRGKRMIFNDFYLGKAYWRWNWADKMSNEDLGLSFEDVLNTLDEKGYTTFSEKMHTGNSYISQTNIFGGLLLFLYNNPLAGKTIGKIISAVSFLSSWKAIEIQTPELNRIEIKKIASSL